MTLSTINCTTGPVAVSNAVKEAFCSEPISHRSEEFRQLFLETTGLLRKEFHVGRAYLLTGSATLANEAMLWQIRSMQSAGLILTNGEFGERLALQANRMKIKHHLCALPWGEEFDMKTIAGLLKENDLKWILFCHCETSTGNINPLEEIIAIAGKNKVSVFADCTSTVGTRAIDLSEIAMATCSSGKGLASLPGLAIVLSNMEPSNDADIPLYVHLAHYDRCGGVAFTISSNMVQALIASVREKLNTHHYEMLKEYGDKIREMLDGYLLFEGSTVFTLSLPNAMRQAMLENGLLLSYESGYLRERGWTQLALFGKYERSDLELVVRTISQSTADSYRDGIPHVGACAIASAPEHGTGRQITAPTDELYVANAYPHIRAANAVQLHFRGANGPGAARR